MDYLIFQPIPISLGLHPFPWQRLLAELLAEGERPEGLDLPTAVGKTACIYTGVDTLAAGRFAGNCPFVWGGTGLRLGTHPLCTQDMRWDG